MALHAIFDTPRDRLIWDVGHQAYPHKILTGRRDRIRTLRQGGGLSGFTRRAGERIRPVRRGAFLHLDLRRPRHGGGARSEERACQGGGVRRSGRPQCDRVIGDGAMSAGMAYEAMNNAGARHSRLIVILNDNDMSIAPPVGAMSAYLSRLMSSRSFLNLRDLAVRMAKRFPRPIERTARRGEEYARGMLTGGTLFEELGFYYVGPIDGHNLDHLLPVLRNVREAEEQGPILVHVITQKGKGYAPGRRLGRQAARVAKFNVVTGEQAKAPPGPPSYTNVFADALIAEAEKDKGIVAITAAMPSGTGLDKFAKRFPDRCFDVGIAEQHAVTFAAGMATEGMKPFCAIYSTFLQRAYDQVVHDVAIQRLPVRFAMDRAGLVGADGATHAGSFDLAYLGCLPGMVVMASVRRGGTGAHGGDRRCDRRPALGAALSARRGRRRGPAERARCWRSARAACCGKAAASRSCHSAPRLADAMRAADELAARGSAGHRRRCPLRQAARHRADRAAGAPSRGADHHRGGRGRRLRQRRVAASGVEGPARRRAEGAPDGAAGPLYRP